MERGTHILQQTVRSKLTRKERSRECIFVHSLFFAYQFDMINIISRGIREEVMKISTKGRYALRLMLDLALNGNGELVRIRTIAQRQEISEKYLEQIISVLNHAGFVRSVRGAQGGYRLAKEPKEYTVGMILRLTEGSLASVACLEDEENLCERVEQCATLEVYKRIDEAVNGVVDNITLQDLVDWHIQKGNNYVI